MASFRLQKTFTGILVMLMAVALIGTGDISAQQKNEPVKAGVPAKADAKDVNPKGPAPKNPAIKGAPARAEAKEAGTKEPAPKEPVKKQIREFALNFKDVDIREFINIMSQLIGKNIIVDDRVQGKISISSAKKVPVSEAYNILKSILEIKGLSLVETGELIKIIPIQDAIKKNTEVIIDDKTKKFPSSPDQTVTYILEIRNGDANEIANVLRQIKSKFTDIVIYVPMNMIIFSGTSSEIEGLVKIVEILDKKIPVQEAQIQQYKGNIHVVHLENANAEDLANVLSRVPFSDKALIETAPIQRNIPPVPKPNITGQAQIAQVAATQRPKLSIIANKESNSLIITATPEEFKEISNVIKELDIIREQVLIEALIIEVTAEYGWGFGIDWMLGTRMGKNMFGGSQISSVPNFSKPDSLQDKTLALPLSTGFQLGYMADTSLLSFAVLNASETDRNFNVLSTPQILTVDNQEAELNVGEEIAIPTNNRIATDGTQFYTFEYKPVGVKLKITPHITQKKRITLDLYQEVNSVLGTTTVLDKGGFIPPNLLKRDIKTKVTVYDGKTIVVGGLIRNEKTTSEIGVPLLKEIPLLGWLFKRKSFSNNKTNLLVFITPHIVTRKEVLDAITRQKMNNQRRLRK